MNYSPIREFFYNCRRNVNFVVGFLMILSLILVAIFAQQIAPYDYDEPHKQAKLQAPNSTYLSVRMISAAICSARLSTARA